MEGAGVEKGKGPIAQGDEQFPGEVGGQAEGLGIEKVAPAPDGLAQGYRGYQHIQQRPEGQFAPTAVQHRGDAAAQQRSMNGDAPMPNGEGFSPVAGVLAPLQ